MNNTQLLLAILLLSSLYSCKNDIDINAPWREIPVVYGFLDPNTSTQYIRIQKAYQNSISQTTQQGAQYTDSLYFDTIVVTVKSEGVSTPFYRTTEIPKETGYFSNGTHYLYKGQLNITPGKNYSLEIFSPKTGNTYLASTTAIGPSAISAATTRFQLASSRIIVTTNLSAGSASNGAFLYLTYAEFPAGNPSAADTLQALYNVVEPYSTNGNYSILSVTFTNAIRSLIPVKTGIERRIIGLDFTAIGAGKELVDLIQVSQPSISIVQKSIEYSNISGGLGIFSSRSEKGTPNIQAITASNLDAWNNEQPTGTGTILPQKEILRQQLNLGKDLKFIP
jgi:hypothetical protein